MRITARAILAAVVVSAMSLLIRCCVGAATAVGERARDRAPAARAEGRIRGLSTAPCPARSSNIKDQLLQTNLSYQKDLNEVAAKLRPGPATGATRDRQ